MQNQSIQYGINKSNLLQIIEHLTACDSAFVPALTTKLELDQYSKKIVEYATRFEAFYNNRLIGLIACYLNDYKSQTGFITNVSVISAFNGKGVAKQLLSMLLQYAAENNFNTISLEVNKLNVPAYKLYKRAGFVLANESHDILQMTIQISDNKNII